MVKPDWSGEQGDRDGQRGMKRGPRSARGGGVGWEETTKRRKKGATPPSEKPATSVSPRLQTSGRYRLRPRVDLMLIQVAPAPSMRRAPAGIAAAGATAPR